jgi:hypothetical protein
MENATVKNLVKQWQQLYMLIHKRQDMERLEPSACRVMADYLSEFTGIPLNNRMGATIMELWLVIFLAISNEINSCVLFYDLRRFSIQLFFHSQWTNTNNRFGIVRK